MTRLERILRAGIRQGWRRGVTGGSRGWTVVGAVAGVAWLAKRALKRSEEVVFSQKLAPGETLQIFHEPES